MTKEGTASHKISKREKEHAEMLKLALARPGVREAMKVYENWKEKDRGLDAYRSATKEPEEVQTTNYTTAR